MLFVEPHVVAFVVVADRYCRSPARFDVTCNNITSRWLGKASQCRLEVSWHGDTAQKARRLRATMQSSPLVELASVGLALILVERVLRLGAFDLDQYSEPAGYP